MSKTNQYQLPDVRPKP